MKAFTASYLLPISHPPIENGAVVVDEGKIIACGPSGEILKKYPDARRENFEKSVLMPGLVNAHTQLELLNFEGDSSRYLSWLLESWDYRKKITPAERRNSFTEGVKQLLRSGTTCLGDCGNFAGLAPTARTVPIRSVLFPEILSSGEKSIQDHFEAAFSQVEEIRPSEGGLSRVSAGIAPYAAYTLSRNLLKIIGRHAAAAKIPLKIHVAESFSEMQFFYDSKGELADELFPKLGWGEELPPPHRKTPIQYLESIGLLESGTILVGCIQLGAHDLQIIARSGARVVQTPRANARLKLGTAPIKKLLRAKVPVGLGTDGMTSHLSLSLWDELRFLLDNSPGGPLTPGELLSMATLGGAQALGLGKQIGSLEPGKQADLITVQIPGKLTAGDLPGWLVRNATDQRVVAVFIDGERVDGRRH